MQYEKAIAKKIKHGKGVKRLLRAILAIVLFVIIPAIVFAIAMIALFVGMMLIVDATPWGVLFMIMFFVLPLAFLYFLLVVIAIIIMICMIVGQGKRVVYPSQ